MQFASFFIQFAFTIFFSYLPVYMWRQLNKVNQKDDFSELLHLMSAKQMHTDADFDNNRVCNKGFIHFIQNVIIRSFTLLTERLSCMSACFVVLPLQVAPLYWFVCSHSKDHLINTPFILLFTGSHPTMQWASKMGSRVSLLRQWIRDWEVCFQNYELPYVTCLQCSDFSWICIRALMSHLVQYHCKEMPEA